MLLQQMKRVVVIEVPQNPNDVENKGPKVIWELVRGPSIGKIRQALVGAGIGIAGSDFTGVTFTEKTIPMEESCMSSREFWHKAKLLKEEKAENRRLAAQQEVAGFPATVTPRKHPRRRAKQDELQNFISACRGGRLESARVVLRILNRFHGGIEWEIITIDTTDRDAVEEALEQMKLSPDEHTIALQEAPTVISLEMFQRRCKKFGATRPLSVATPRAISGPRRVL